MASDEPGSNDWASPGQAPPPPPYTGPDGTGGWPTAPPPPPPPYGGYGQQPQSPWAGQVMPQAPKPGVIPLRPLGVGELLDGAFTTIRRYPAATLGLAAVVMLVVEAIQVPASYYLLHGVTTDLSGRQHTLDVITGVTTLISTTVLAGMLTAVVGQAVLGRPMSVGDAWRSFRPRLWQLLGATLLIIAIAIGIELVGALPGIIIWVAGAPTGGKAVAVLGAFATFFFNIYVLVTLTFTTPALILEKQGIRAAMSRSRALIKGSWWRVFGIVLLAGVIGEVIAGIIVIPFSYNTFASILSGHPADQYRFTPLLLTGIGTLIATTLVRPFSAGVVALLYLDRRMRAEALDLTLQQAAAKNSA